MGIRGEIYSTRVQLQNRTYFFNVKENRLGDIYLNIVESKNKDEGGFERQSVVLFADDLAQFLSGFEESLKVMDKADREKKRKAPADRPPSAAARPLQESARGERRGTPPPQRKRVIVKKRDGSDRGPKPHHKPSGKFHPVIKRDRD
jgi:hypothetical protein